MLSVSTDKEETFRASTSTFVQKPQITIGKSNDCGRPYTKEMADLSSTSCSSNDKTRARANGADEGHKKPSTSSFYSSGANGSNHDVVNGSPSSTRMNKRKNVTPSLLEESDHGESPSSIGIKKTVE
uniref:Uncharacterized protein n=1 Tax=Daphnia galeata TaxID=27404 RepID=A0A8J2REY2_9CRUS|nr:unnamed protein product [Daphnia galeata]